MAACLFCKLINGEAPADIVFESDNVFAFNDINPQAPYHIQIIPKKHIPTLNDLSHGDAELIGELVLTAAKIARDLGIDDAGYRTLFNCNRGGGQMIYHIHLHLMGGRQMTWPPG